MHLNQLWVFYQVAKHKSFSQAAEALFLSQPSVIEEIKGLKAGGIRISASNTLGAYYLPDILDLFRKKHPQIEI
jgi:DNA-binding transcriptional LysR family regulator